MQLAHQKGETQMSEYHGYPDSQGWLHPTQEEALRENQRTESDYSRGYSGNCPQDPANVPPPPQKPSEK